MPHRPHTPEPSTIDSDNDNPAIIQTSPNSRSFHSDSSKRTSSDKLSALPLSLPGSPRNRHNHNFKRGTEGSSLLPRDSLISSSPNLSAAAYRSNAFESSQAGNDSPRQRRISFESDNSAHTLRSTHLMANHFGSHSRNSPSVGAASLVLPSRHGRSDSQGFQTQSRAASPLQIIQRSLHLGHSREEPFVAVDPFKWHFRCNPSPGKPGHDEEQARCLEAPFPLPCCFSYLTTKTSPQADALLSNSRTFLSDTLPRQLYLIILLRLPAIYFSRVARVFEDAEVSKRDMQRIIDSARGKPADNQAVGRVQGGTAAAPSDPNDIGSPLPLLDEWVPPAVSVPLARFKNSWEDFIDSLMREWKTLNLVSALLCSAILTTFQVPAMTDDPVTRTAALISLVCALMSLSYGCMFILRFGTMRSMLRASRWAEEAQRSKTSILWNVWVLLATPAVWIAWSMVAFIVSILSYVWRSGSTSDPAGGVWPQLTPQQALGPRLAITTVVAIGLIYFGLIMKTFTQYGMNGVNRTPLLAASERNTTSGEIMRGRTRERNVDEGKSGRELSVSVRPSGVGLGLDLTPGHGGSRQDEDLEKGAGGGIELEIQSRG